MASSPSALASDAGSFGVCSLSAARTATIPVDERASYSVAYGSMGMGRRLPQPRAGWAKTQDFAERRSDQSSLYAQHVCHAERQCRRLGPDIAARDELWRGGADFAEEAEEGESSQYFKIGPSDKFNSKFVRAAPGNFYVYFFVCLSPEWLNGPVVYFGFIVDWSVFTLCLWYYLISVWCFILDWCFIFFTWFILFDASEEDGLHLTDET